MIKDKDKDTRILELIENDKSFDKGISLLIATYQERLYWHIRRILEVHEDTDDVLQNVFIKVFKNIKGFKKDSKLYTWLYRIATNEALNYLKKRNKNLSEDLDVVKMNPPISHSEINPEKTQKILKEAIHTLPDKQRLIFNLRYYDEMPYKEMSEVLDTSIGALKASFHHATKKIENYLKTNIQFI